VIYNAKVQEDRYFRTFARRLVGTAGEPIPVDQEYRRFITERTAFLREVPSQILRNGAVKFRIAYQRFFRQLGGRPKIHRKSGRQAVWITNELFEFLPDTDAATGALVGYRLTVGAKKFPVGVIPYTAHRTHAIPHSIHIAVEGGHWWLSFSAEDPTVTLPGKTADAATAQIAEDLRHLSPAPLTEQTLGGDRGIAKPLTTSDGAVYDLAPVQKKRIHKHRGRKKPWQRKAARRKKGSQNPKKTYRRMARQGDYAPRVRQDYAHQTSHRLVARPDVALYVFEDLRIKNLTKRPKAQQDAQGRWVHNGARAKAGLN